MHCVPSVADLVHELRAFHGHRTLWLDERRGTVLHAEPEEELEAFGYRYVATLMRPGPEALAEALGRVGLRPEPAVDRSVAMPWAVASEPASA